MSPFSFVLLYVENPEKSAAFYARLLGQKVADASPNFAMLPLGTGVMLGLWARHDVQPAATQIGGSEVCFTAADALEVKATHADWKEHGLTIAQPPTKMDFGFTFVALDPDGHRLRVFAPNVPAN